jgi:hypothetical protein
MEEYIRLQQRNDEIWDLLEDPTLPPLDRQMLDEELIRNNFEILRFEDEAAYDDDDETLTIVSYESESIGADEYDREGVIANEDFDLANEI